MKTDNRNFLMNCLGKACLSVFLAIPLFAAPDGATEGINPKVTQATGDVGNRYGWFWGAGFNLGADRVEYRGRGNSKRKTFATGGFGGKIGGYARINSWLLARSYFGYDADLNLLYNPKTFFNPPLNPNASGEQYQYILYETYSLNLDFIFNVYTNQKLDVGLILGEEISLMNITKGARLGSSYTKSSNYYRRFVTKFKVGARVMFGENKKYGVELIERIGQNLQVPFAGSDLSTDGNNYLTSIHFVMEM